MSRKIITMCVVLAFLALLSIAEQLLVRAVTDGALEETAQILSDIRAGSFDTAQKKAHALDETWDKQANILETMVDHRSTDEVRYALSKLLAALESEDRASSLIYAGELEGGIEHVFERQELSLQNVF